MNKKTGRVGGFAASGGITPAFFIAILLLYCVRILLGAMVTTDDRVSSHKSRHIKDRPIKNQMVRFDVSCGIFIGLPFDPAPKSG